MDLVDFFERKDFASIIYGKMELDSSRRKTPYDSPVAGPDWKKLQLADAKQTQVAIQSAQEAFLLWKEMPAPVRAKHLHNLGDALIEHKVPFARAMALEMGKPLKQGEQEVEYAAGFFYWFAGEAERIYGQMIPASTSDKVLQIRHEPVGVCGLITPWNFPLAMPARKVGAALAAGCTVVLKPSPETPLTALGLARVADEIGLPPGVINVVIGPEKQIGQMLLTSPTVKKISFTGSTQVGKYLYEHSAQTLKKLSLELGGHAPLIVFDDADLDLAVKGTLAAKFRNNGQTCIAPNRIFVQESIYDEFSSKLVNAAEKLKVGDPLQLETEISYVLHPASLEKVKQHTEDALKKGGKVLLQGQEPYEPTILGEVTNKMLIFKEETFGPLLPLISFTDSDQAIELANDTPYGLSAYAFTERLSLVEKLARQLEYGIIGINDARPSAPQACFGGVKDSGFGREGGPTGIDEFLVQKYLSIQTTQYQSQDQSS